MPKDLRGVLVLDNHECHKIIREELAQCNVDVIFFPPNCTSLIQPLEISVNKRIKDKYKDI